MAKIKFVISEKRTRIVRGIWEQEDSPEGWKQIMKHLMESNQHSPVRLEANTLSSILMNLNDSPVYVKATGQMLEEME